MATKADRTTRPATAPIPAAASPAQPAKAPAQPRRASAPVVEAAAEPGVDPAARTQPFKVHAFRMGYYGEKRRRVGDVFTFHPGKGQTFDPSWMAETDPAAAEQSESPRDAQRREHAAIRENRGVRPTVPALERDAADEDAGDDKSTNRDVLQ